MKHNGMVNRANRGIRDDVSYEVVFGESMTASYVMICSSCLCGTATHGAHGSSFKSKAARAITAIFPATGISAQDISPCGGYVNMSFMLCELLFFSLQSTHLCNMKQNRYQNAAFGCFGLMPLYAPIFLPRRQ